ncbi:hypothetical protein ACFL1Q_01020 [Patescibacteria group bacterium]
MGYFGKLEEKEKVLRLRKKGLSYNEIKRVVPVSKSSLSRWCRDVYITPEQVFRLYKNKLEGSERGRIIGAKKLQEARIARTLALYKEGRRDVGKISRRDYFIAGIGLYAGDGIKGDKMVGFSNSNPKMIKFMSGWLRSFCSVPLERMSCQIWIHDNLDETKARIFWSRITGVPLKRFNKSYIARNKIESNKIRKNIHKYGVCTINITSAEIQRKILGWMGGILDT